MRCRRIYEAFRTHGYTLLLLQEYLGLHSSTISRIAKRVAEAQTLKKET
jgi:hypothetical protein